MAKLAIGTAPKLMPLHLWARLRGRSFWELRYHDGTIIDERDVDWSLAPTKGRIEVRLVCPNGKVAVLGNTKDATDRLFQMKVGRVNVGGPKDREVLAHIIGLIHGLNGECTLYAWQWPGELVGPIEDNAFNLKYEQIGRIYGPHVGAKPD